MKTSAAVSVSVSVSVLFCTSLAVAQSELPEPRVAISPELDQGRAPESNRVRPGDRAVAFADLGASVSPVGAWLATGMYFRHTFAADERGKFEKSYLQGGIGLGVSPASFQPSAHVEYLPVPFLALRADFAATRYFGASYGLLRFESADADFGGDALSERRGDERAAWGVKGGLSLLPRAKLGPVLVLSKVSFTGYRYDDAGPYVYEAELDTLLSTTDYVFTSRTDFLFRLHEGAGAESFMLGPMIESMRTLDSELSRTRLGATAWFVPSDRWANLSRPRLYAKAGINVDDPNRSGEPFAVLGIGADME